MEIIAVHFILYFFIIRIYWHNTCGICWHSICLTFWYTICDARGLISPYRCRITSFSQLKQIFQSDQDAFFSFGLLCSFYNKTKQNVFNWTQAKVIFDCHLVMLPIFFLFFSRHECRLKRLEIWTVISIRQTSTTAVA